MTELVKFSAEVKEIAGKGAARALRRDGKIPVVIYGGDKKPEMFAISLREFSKEYLKGGIKTRLVEIFDGKRTISAITKDIQTHPVSDDPVHVDFLRVDKDTSVRVEVTIRVINEDKSPGIKKGGIANIVNRKVAFLCHPSNIPHHIEIDLSDLEIGHIVHINDIKLPEGVRPVDASNFTVVTIIGRVEEDDKATATADASTTASA